MDTQSLVAGRPDDLNFEKKTASASESLAHNLAANAADGEETVHGRTMGQSGAVRQEPRKSLFRRENSLPQR